MAVEFPLNTSKKLFCTQRICEGSVIDSFVDIHFHRVQVDYGCDKETQVLKIRTA
jgi:hypothetical protein